MNTWRRMLEKENVCIQFDKTITLNGGTPVWSATFGDYSGTELVRIIPDDHSFLPKNLSLYLVQRPRPYDDELKCGKYQDKDVFRVPIMEIELDKLVGCFYVYKPVPYFIPPCASKKRDKSVIFRSSKTQNNDLAIIWVKDEDLRERIFNALEDQKCPSLKINRWGIITFEDIKGEGVKSLKERTIRTIQSCLEN